MIYHMMDLNIKDKELLSSSRASRDSLRYSLSKQPLSTPSGVVDKVDLTQAIRRSLLGPKISRGGERARCGLLRIMPRAWVGG
jgi:hypothetical protein